MGKTGKNKRFIDKKNSVTYHLVHRSQKDPLTADEDASKYVLEPIGPVIKEIERKLPPTVFASKEEEEVGLLNKAAPVRGPQPNWDPDIAARFDDEFDENDEALDDDFILKANAEVSHVKQKDEEEENDNDCDSDDLWDEFEDDCDGNKSETKSRFTEYSVSSSVLPRTKGLKNLDDRFEALYEQYDDSEIGALDEDLISGSLMVESEVFKQVVEDYTNKKALESTKEIVQQLEQKYNEEAEHENDDLEKFIVEKPTEKWDCESILTKNSTLYNHPKLISEPSKPKPIRICEKTGIPKDILKGKLTAKNLKQFDRSTNAPSLHKIESKKREKETPEEKRLRKQAVKEHRKERRIEKKLNKEAFKEEKKIQEKLMINVRHKLQTIKIE